MEIKEKIIDIISKNRISSVEVADALGKKGVVEGPIAINTNKFAVGEVQYIYSYLNTNWPIHEQIAKINEGGIVFIDTINCDDNAAFGDIVTKYLVLYKKMDGVIVNAKLRDGHIIKKENYPVWAKGFTPLGFFNKKIKPTKSILNIVERRKRLFDGNIIVCDDSGCTMIDKKYFNEDTLKKLEFIELQEDIWYYCVDTLKWTTYETICEKRYLKEKDTLPKILRDKLDEYKL